MTFNLKDFKAVLVLCEGLNTNVAICFDQPGSPLLVQPTFHSSNPLVRLCIPACLTIMYCSQETALELKPQVLAYRRAGCALEGLQQAVTSSGPIACHSSIR